MTQYAQLKAGPPTHGLERGHWYPVEAVTTGGVVRVLGPNAVGVVLDTQSLRIVDHPPEAITRVEGTGVQPIEPGQPTPMMSYYGVCPKGHRVGDLTYVVERARCGKCGAEYPIEDEERF